MSRAVSSGRPKLPIPEETLLEFINCGFKWKQISNMLLVSTWTIRQRVVELESVGGVRYLEPQQHSPPSPSDDGLSSVEVQDVVQEFLDEAVDHLQNQVDPCAPSADFGIDVYQRALDIMNIN
eukprot:gene13228-14583_t